MPPGDIAPVLMGIVFMASAAAVLIFRGPVGRAIARRIEGTSGQVEGPDLADVQGRIAELEQRMLSVQELEERLDFTERLLAQQREQPRLGS